MKLFERDSAIIFDEIHMFPLARQMIKELVEDGRYDYIETGSLIGLKQNISKILIPSGEHRIQMHPMDFEEFMWAFGDEQTIPYLRSKFETRTPLGKQSHRDVMLQYTRYMIVGGMPAVVAAFIKENNYQAAEREKNEIWNLYLDDSVKIRIGRTAKCRRLLELVPSMLSKHDKTFAPSEISRDTRTRDYVDAIFGLGESKMVNLCQNATDISVALEMNLDDEGYKLYLADTGLLFTAVFGNNRGSIDDVYNAILSGRLNINKGMLFENMIAQELVCTGHKLRYCRFGVRDSNQSYEVDFINPVGRKLQVIESKSGYSGTHASLDRFMEKYSKHIDKAYVVHSKDMRTDGAIDYIPIYMTMFIE